MACHKQKISHGIFNCRVQNEIVFRLRRFCSHCSDAVAKSGVVTDIKKLSLLSQHQQLMPWMTLEVGSLSEINTIEIALIYSRGDIHWVLHEYFDRLCCFFLIFFYFWSQPRESINQSVSTYSTTGLDVPIMTSNASQIQFFCQFRGRSSIRQILFIC